MAPDGNSDVAGSGWESSSLDSFARESGSILSDAVKGERAAALEYLKKQHFLFALMITFVVIMLCEFSCRTPQRELAKQNQFWQTLFFNPSRPALREGIHIWTKGWQQNRLNSAGFEHGSE
jgi:hypothetical protein